MRIEETKAKVDWLTLFTWTGVFVFGIGFWTVMYMIFSS